MAKVSVIVPVYGVEQYIERCARSLFEQTLDDVEYIFIDDCTPDNSIVILERVLKNYPSRIAQTKIVRMPHNSGLAAVRKHGVGIASGEFIIACDSDDYVDKDMYERMYLFAIEHNLDLVQCDIDLVVDNRVIQTLSSSKPTLSSQELKSMIIDGKIAASLCNKLVKREIYQNERLTFPVAGMDEDNTMSCQLAYFSSSLGYIGTPFYKAYYNTSSMSRSPGESIILKRYEEALENSRIAVDFLLSHGYNNNSISVLKAKIRPRNTLIPLLNSFKYYRIWMNTFPEINNKIIMNSNFSFRERIKFLLIVTSVYTIFEKIVRLG